MQNRDIIMQKVGKCFMIIGIAGILSLLFVEWSRWNLVPLSAKFKAIALSKNYSQFNTEFIEGIIGTVSIFTLFAAPSLLRWDNRSEINIMGLIFAIVMDIAGIMTVIVRGEIFGSYVVIVLLSMCIYVKNTIDILHKLYHWIKTGTEDNQYDIAKMTFIWVIIAFIIGKIW